MGIIKSLDTTVYNYNLLSLWLILVIISYLFLNVMHINMDKSVWAKITGQNGALPYVWDKKIIDLI